MKPGKGKCAGQVIIEKEFASEDAAQEWMARIANRYEPTVDHVETHLWITVDSDSVRRRAEGMSEAWQQIEVTQEPTTIDYMVYDADGDRWVRRVGGWYLAGHRPVEGTSWADLCADHGPLFVRADAMP